MPQTLRHLLGRGLLLLGVLALALGGLLTGCAPQAEPTVPAATVMAPQPATELPPTPEQAQEPPAPPTAANDNAVQVTILHTNDVYGEIDPCG
jgi:2',3'-cyclic-nucleotide 2'-phosphodiesterase (5'-nucleotidase family)